MMTDVALTVAQLHPQQLPWWTQMGDLLEDAQDGFAVLDWSMRVVLWNRAASLLTGTSASEMVGYGCEITDNVLTVDLSHRPAAAAPRAPVTGGRDVHLYDLRIKTRGGRFNVVNVAVTLVPMRCDKAYAFLHLAPRAASRQATTSGGIPVALTDRESQILALLAAGKTAKPIATELSVSLPTVRTHVRHILRKLGVHSCLEAAVWFLRARESGNGAMAPGFDVAGSNHLVANGTGYWEDNVDTAQTPPSNSPTFV
jgi:PAS domain S-box-containing protein